MILNEQFMKRYVFTAIIALSLAITASTQRFQVATHSASLLTEQERLAGGTAEKQIDYKHTENQE